MARNEEKAQLMLNKWVTMKEQFNSGQAAERRPFLATDCSSLADCEKWRMQIVREVTKKVAAIQNAGLGEHKIRDLNDNINKLLREKGHWQRRIRDLGGPDYNALEPKALDAEGRPLPGGGGYRYFGAARDLPGVKELFEAPPPQKKRRTRGDMMRNVTPDYYGFRDDDDGGALKAQEAAVERPRVEEARQAELAARAERRARNDGAESSDDDPLDEPALLDGIRRATDASAQAFEEVMGGGGAQDLAGRKRALLEALGADDDSEVIPLRNLRALSDRSASASVVVRIGLTNGGRPEEGDWSERVFHGTDMENVPQIVGGGGIDPSPAANRSVHGAGVYTTPALPLALNYALTHHGLAAGPDRGVDVGGKLYDVAAVFECELAQNFKACPSTWPEVHYAFSKEEIATLEWVVPAAADCHVTNALFFFVERPRDDRTTRTHKRSKARDAEERLGESPSKSVKRRRGG